VTPGKIGPNAVGPSNIGNGAVTSAKIGGGAVIAASIKNSVVTTNKLQKGAVTSEKLGANAVGTTNIANGSVTPAKLSTEIGGTVAPLKSGQTLRGVFDVGGTAAAAGGTAKGAVSYLMPLVNPPAVTVLKPGETSANCGGLGGGATPAATAGNLCVYLTERTNLDETELAKLVESNTRLGFGLSAKALAGGNFSAIGQWAVTAP